MQDRDRRPARASTISNKRSVRSLPGRLLELHPLAILAGDDPEAIVLDFMQTARRRAALALSSVGRAERTRPAGYADAAACGTK